MNDHMTTALAAAAGGYVLGRTRKAKFALVVASWVVSRKFGTTPAGLLGKGARALYTSPHFARVADQVRGELMTAGRSAVTASFDRGVGLIADSLHTRSEALRGLSEEAGSAAANGSSGESAGNSPSRNGSGGGGGKGRGGRRSALPAGGGR